MSAKKNQPASTPAPRGARPGPPAAKPGYKHTKLGWIPEEWMTGILGCHFDFLKSASNSRSDLTNNRAEGHLAYIHYGDIHTIYTSPIINVQGNPDIPYLFSTVDISENISFLKSGDLVIADASEDAEGIGKSVELMNVGNTQIISGLHTIAIRNKDGSIEPGFGHLSLRAPNVIRGMRELATGSKVFGLSKTSLASLHIPIPPLPEQRRIAALMGTWDRAIATAQQLLATQQLRKQGLMQQLLSGKTRFKGFGGKWKEVRLGEAFEFLRTTSHSRADLTNDPEQGSVAYIHYGDIHAKYTSPILDLGKNSNVPHLLGSISLKSNVDYLHDGDLVVADASEDYEGVGASIEIAQVSNQHVIAGLHTMAIRDKSNLTVPGFRAYMLRVHAVAKRMRTLASVSKVYGISKTNFASLMLQLPSPEEQQRIVGALQTMDAEIDNLKAQLAHLTEQKRGLMQVLLTGERRLREDQPKP